MTSILGPRNWVGESTILEKDFNSSAATSATGTHAYPFDKALGTIQVIVTDFAQFFLELLLEAGQASLFVRMRGQVGQLLRIGLHVKQFNPV